LDNLPKYVVPVLAILGIGVTGLVALEMTGGTKEAGRAADAVLNAADSVIDNATAESRYRETEEPNYVTVGAIYTSQGNLKATLIVRGTNGADAVCNRMAHIRDYLVVLLSDHPPTRENITDGPTNYDGALDQEINELIGVPAVEQVRFDIFQLGGEGGESNCRR